MGKCCNSATGKPASEVEKNLSQKKFSSISDELQCGDSSRFLVSLWFSLVVLQKNNKVVENRSGSLPEVLDVTALRELVTGNLEKLDRPWKVDVSYFLSFNGLLFFGFKKIEAHLLTSIFHSEYSNPAKKTPSCKLLGRQQLGMQSAVLDNNSTAKISGAVLDNKSTAKYLEQS